MKILHLVSQDSGGAGRACLRLHLALLKQGIDSVMLVQTKTSDIPSVVRLAKTKTQKIIEKLRPALCNLPLAFYPKRHKDIFSIDFLHNGLLIKTINDLNPDIVHLHWINGGFLNIKDLKKIKAPLLWSLHDANPYTGGCHVVAAACVGVSVRCKKCPLLHSSFPFDLSFWGFRAKQKTYKELNLTINGLSRWIARCAKESVLLRDKKIINLPNPIDTEIYSPMDKNTAREILNLSHRKKTIAFGALSATSIERKGYPQLKMALSKLENKENIRIIIFGASANENGEIENIEGIETHYLGHLYDDMSLKLVYNAADVVVVPSLAESFGQVASESIACGTPVVCFDVGGLKDIIEHKKTGYLATPFEASDLSAGIEWVLNLSTQNYQILCQNAQQKAIKNFSSKKVSLDYIKAYENILGGGGLIYQAFYNHSKKTIAFGAISATAIDRKGYPQLKMALSKLENKENLRLIIFGASANEKGNIENIEGIETYYLGHLYDDMSLKLVYNAADVVVIPSLAENLSNAIMESLSCGTPVVAFDIGGNADMITHKQNGYLAKPLDCEDFSAGIAWILGLTPHTYATIAQNARDKVLRDFESATIAKRYIEAYQNILQTNLAIMPIQKNTKESFETSDYQNNQAPF
ncbi:glycosyltransferase [Helicobacter sp. 11S02596-1]|uniref:glycosyltransferase n=1 Tax=Helicobacter sp. 11S02596-1 TaxID=1476194 RepID=UPI000BA5E0B5|nr:glycosyltransferase [Helicobacter sp. 11S02596-1]PAF45194.1 glycosyl transferase [Helicobacter sp. 11S02596-1]